MATETKNETKADPRAQAIEAAARALLAVAPHTSQCADPGGWRPEKCTCEVGALSRALAGRGSLVAREIKPRPRAPVRRGRPAAWGVVRDGRVVLATVDREEARAEAGFRHPRLSPGKVVPLFLATEPRRVEECGSCLGYGHFSRHGKPSADRRDRKCLDCSGAGRRLALAAAEGK